jgi:hypothetical protein
MGRCAQSSIIKMNGARERAFSMRDVVFRVAQRSTTESLQLVRTNVYGDDVERVMGRSAQQIVHALNDALQRLPTSRDTRSSAELPSTG